MSKRKSFIKKKDYIAIKSQLKKLGYKSYDSFLKGKKWKTLKSDILSKYERDRVTCYCCKSPVAMKGEYHFHHKSYNGLLNINNIEIVCKSCHLNIHKQYMIKGYSLQKSTEYVRSNHGKINIIKKKQGIKAKRTAKKKLIAERKRKRGTQEERRREAMDRFGPDN